MKKQTFHLLLAGIILSFLPGGCKRGGPQVFEQKDASGYRYTEVAGDPLHVRLYTLDNGLKVYLSKDPAAARIHTFIGIRTGSLYEPPDAAGTTDYLRYLLFQGTDKIGTCDWQKEKPLLDRIPGLLEQYRRERQYLRKKALFHQIDSISRAAGRYAVPGEYRQLTHSIDVRDMGSYVAYDQTEYSATIPSNELERWAALESERFRHPVFRLFTEGMTQVIRNFNYLQRDDNYQAQQALLAALFPGLPFGPNRTGLAEQIAHPSLKSIARFYDRYYVPGNMALALTGDLDPEMTIRILDRYFGNMPAKEADLPDLPPAKPVEGPIEKTITGPSEESVMIGFRFPGAGSREEKFVTLIDGILNDSRFGLLVTDLKKKQKVRMAGCGLFRMRDHTVHSFYVAPLPGQSPEEAKELLLAEIDKVKKGDFDDLLPEMVANNLHRTAMEKMTKIPDRAAALMNTFFGDIPWPDRVNYYNDLKKISKGDLVKFAREHYKNNYVVVFKRKGIPGRAALAEMPETSPADEHCPKHSEYYQTFIAEKAAPIEPVFIDFDQSIRHDSLPGGIRIDLIPNTVNDLFTLEYRFDMGRDNDLLLSLAMQYLPYLGTDRYTTAGLQKELYRLGLELSVYTSSRNSYLRLTGLPSSFEEGVQLLEHIVHHAVPDEKAYQQYLENIRKNREAQQQKRSVILQGALLNYGKFGKHSPFTHRLSMEDLKHIDPARLTGLIHDLFHYRHTVFYYGTAPLPRVKSTLEKYHAIPPDLQDPPPPVHYEEQESRGDIFWLPWDKQQTYLLMVARDVPQNIALFPQSALFNACCGSGTAAVLQEKIRAGNLPVRSVLARYDMPAAPGYSHYLTVLAELQPDRTPQALTLLTSLLQHLTVSEEAFVQARQTVMNDIRNERITGTEIYAAWLKGKERGIDHDLRKDVYYGVEKMTPEDLEEFIRKHVSGKQFTYLILGNKEDAGIRELLEKKRVRVMRWEEVFGK